MCLNYLHIETTMKVARAKTFHTPLILPTYYIYWAHNIVLYSLIVILLLSIERRFFSSTNLWRCVCQYPTASDINVDRFLWNSSQVLLQVSQTMNLKTRHVQQRGRVCLRENGYVDVRAWVSAWMFTAPLVYKMVAICSELGIQSLLFRSSYNLQVRPKYCLQV